MTETLSHVLKAAIAGVIGAAIGWGANSLTFTGRVDALEKGQHRIESLIIKLIEAKGLQP